MCVFGCACVCVRARVCVHMRVCGGEGASLNKYHASCMVHGSIKIYYVYILLYYDIKHMDA